MNYLSSISLDIRQKGVQRGWMEYTEVLVAPANPDFDNVRYISSKICLGRLSILMTFSLMLD